VPPSDEGEDGLARPVLADWAAPAVRDSVAATVGVSRPSLMRPDGAVSLLKSPFLL
jgi:hypothetical protein